MAKSGTERRSGFSYRRWLLLSLDVVFAIVVALLTVGDRLGFFVAHSFSSLSPPDRLPDETIETFFKYGSIGTEAVEGMPKEMWDVLLDVCPLPGANPDARFPSPDVLYAYFGIAHTEGRPIGFSRRKASILGLKITERTRVSINCALCHTASYRLSPEEQKRHVVVGGPAHQLAAQEGLKFLINCAEGLTARKIIEKRGGSLFAWKNLRYYLLAPITRRGILARKEQFAFAETQQPWGHGRFDAMNGSKTRLLGMLFDGTDGVADMPSVWRLDPTHVRNWDGNHTSLTEAIRTEALVTGTPKEELDRVINNLQPPQCEEDGASETSTVATLCNELKEGMDEHLTDANLMCLKRILQCLRRPKFPFAPQSPADVDNGRDIFFQHCAGCHAAKKNGAPTRLGTVIPLDEVGTDSSRLRSWTREATEKKNRLGKGYDWELSQARKTDGYVAVPLDGIWLRAPYLHNGSVPTLRDLLKPLEGRPTRFYRGYDVLDDKNVGFIANVPEEQIAEGIVRKFFEFDTTKPGNWNGGHLFGTTLLEAEKDALLEYLKTL
jgi:hypothetical protein